MSIHLTSLVWEISFPTATQKLLMLRVTDYAHDDGHGIYPSIPEVSRQTGASERQVQYAIRALEGAGLLVRVVSGGQAINRTNVWRVDVDLLARLALQELVLEGSHMELKVEEAKGAIIAPRTLQRVQSRLQRVQSATPKGAAHCTQTLREPLKEPSRASARATETAARSRFLPSIPLTSKDVSWQSWLDHIETIAGAEVRATVEGLGEITVSSRWPEADTPLPALPLKPSVIRNPAGADQ